MATEVGYGIVFVLKYIRVLQALHDYHFKTKQNRPLRNYFGSFWWKRKKPQPAWRYTPTFDPDGFEAKSSCELINIWIFIFLEINTKAQVER